MTTQARHPDEGRRLRLLSCSDPHTRLTSGAEGTVGFVDSLGTLHVDWDDGHKLGLVPGEDRWEWLPRPVPDRQSDAWSIEQRPQRQDSLRDQLVTVHEAATRLGCYDAADWLWKNALVVGRPR